MAITTVSQSQVSQDTAKNSQVVTTVTKNFNSGSYSGPNITSVIITDSSYNNLDDTAVTTSNGYIKIIGTGFAPTANVYIGSSVVPAANVTFVSSTEIRARVPSLTAGNYSLSLFNTNASGTISSSTFIVSTGPAWVTGATLTDQISGTTFGVNLSATSDSTITYTNTTALPAGTTLAANGYFSGTVTTGSQTTYNFDIKATDAENQDATKTFSLTINVVSYKLWSWGYNPNGELGTNSVEFKSSPVQIGTNINWSSISGGLFHGYGLKTDGTLWSWGQNGYGQLGQNNQVARSSPTQVGTGTTWLKLAKNGTYWLSSAIKSDGTLWAWGYNNGGVLGQNDTVNRSSPVQIGSGTDWQSVTMVGAPSILAIKTNGTLWSWGIGVAGALGLNDVVSRSSPVQVGALTNWSQISSGSYSVLAIKTDGTLWGWGSNLSGGLGLSDTNRRSSPTQIGTGTNWSSVRVSGTGENDYVIAIKNDGYAWTWGQNNTGQLGQNDRIPRSSPVQVYSLDTWSTNPSKIGGTLTSINIIKSNGTLWTWGQNNSGQAGTNDVVDRSSPTQIGTATNWYSLSSTPSYTSRAITN